MARSKWVKQFQVTLQCVADYDPAQTTDALLEAKVKSWLEDLCPKNAGYPDIVKVATDTNNNTAASPAASSSIDA
jgi:hypothetical protein